MSVIVIAGVGVWTYLSDSQRLTPAHFDDASPVFADLRVSPGAPDATHPSALQGAAETGDIEAQYLLGSGLIQRSWERGEPLAIPEAAKWIRKAADQNDPRAQCLLGSLYEKGRGFIQDYGLARHWYMRAAQQGDPRAMLRLGLLFSRGRGIEQSVSQAYIWLNLAASRGEPGAEGERNRLRSMLSTEDLKAAQENSRDLDAKIPRLKKKPQELPLGF